MSGFSRGKLEAGKNELGLCTARYESKKIFAKIAVLRRVLATYICYKWKNHFYEMKGDVGVSVHEKERKQEDAYTKTQTHS